jgi:hypothetical protein
MAIGIQCSNWFRCTIVCCSFVANVVTGPLYLMQIYTLFKHTKQHFNSPFFTIYKLNAMWDFVCCCAHMSPTTHKQLQIRVMILTVNITAEFSPLSYMFNGIVGLFPGIYPKCLAFITIFTQFIAVMLYLLFYTLNATRACLIVMTFNRFTAVVMGAKHNQVVAYLNIVFIISLSFRIFQFWTKTTTAAFTVFFHILAIGALTGFLVSGTFAGHEHFYLPMYPSPNATLVGVVCLYIRRHFIEYSTAIVHQFVISTTISCSSLHRSHRS